MSTNSSIEWTDASWQVTAGCTKVSPGCANCYAERMAYRLASMHVEPYSLGVVAGVNGKPAKNEEGVSFTPRWTGRVVTIEKNLEEPLRWRKPRRVFVDSMSDLFHEDVPFDFIDRVFAVMALCPQHTFQILTKRPARMGEYFNAPIPLSDRANNVAGMHPTRINGKLFTWGEPIRWGQRGWNDDPYDRRPWPGWPLKNVWLGTSVEDQQRADERIPELLKCPAAVRFLSCEPLLGAIDLSREPYPLAIYSEAKGCQFRSQPGNQLIGFGEGGYRKISAPPRISWVIAGGESGPKARPTNVAWIRSIVEQCKAAGVACFVKQLGANATFYDDGDGAGGTIYEFRLGPPDYPSIRDKKGGEPSEWPIDLRVRQMPAVPAGVNA